MCARRDRRSTCRLRSDCSPPRERSPAAPSTTPWCWASCRWTAASTAFAASCRSRSPPAGSGCAGCSCRRRTRPKHRVVGGLDVCVARSLAEALDALNRPDAAERAPATARPAGRPTRCVATAISRTCVGSCFPRRALEVAAAGGHNLLLIGTARRRQDDAGEAAGGHPAAADVRRSAGVHGHPLGRRHACRLEPASCATRPFRAPHHTISNVALVGGGVDPAAGRNLARAQRRAVPRRDAGIRSARARSAAAAARRRARDDRARGANGGVPGALRPRRGDEPVSVRLPRRRAPCAAAARQRRSRSIAAACLGRCAIASISSSTSRRCP